MGRGDRRHSGKTRQKISQRRFKERQKRKKSGGRVQSNAATTTPPKSEPVATATPATEAPSS